MARAYAPGLATMRKIATTTSNSASPPNMSALRRSRSILRAAAPVALGELGQAHVGRHEHPAREPEQDEAGSRTSR